jgi:ABC-type nitrate/sulfonate/bicarbonate transport system permease component
MILGDVNLDTELLFAALTIVTIFGFILYSLIELAHAAVLRRFGGGESQQLLTL